jgi:hypothetical protein
VELHVHRSLRTVVLDDGHPSYGRSFAQGTVPCGVPDHMFHSEQW